MKIDYISGFLQKTAPRNKFLRPFYEPLNSAPKQQYFNAVPVLPKNLKCHHNETIEQWKA